MSETSSLGYIPTETLQVIVDLLYHVDKDRNEEKGTYHAYVWGRFIRVSGYRTSDVKLGSCHQPLTTKYLPGRP